MKWAASPLNSPSRYTQYCLTHHLSMTHSHHKNKNISKCNIHRPQYQQTRVNAMLLKYPLSMLIMVNHIANIQDILILFHYLVYHFSGHTVE